MNLIIQPEAGLAPVVQAIQKARRTVDIAIFRIDRRRDREGARRGGPARRPVRVLVAHTNRGGEGRLRKLEQRLLEAGATVTRTGDDFPRYHGKFMVADDTLHLFGFNFTKVDTPRAAASASRRGTRARSAKRGAVRGRLHAATVRARSARGWSSARRTRARLLTAFVKGAKRQLLIYDVNLQDPVFIKLLEAAGGGRRRRARDRQVQGRDEIDVRPLKSTRGCTCAPSFVTARAPSSGVRACGGSSSIRRREVGVLITNAAVARQIRDIFEADWAEAESAPRNQRVPVESSSSRRGNSPESTSVPSREIVSKNR